jgi:hypothetical protein
MDNYCQRWKVDQKFNAFLHLNGEEGTYLYELQAIDHQRKSAVGQLLIV